MSDINKSFDILNLPPNVPYAEAKAAYRELASILHPDKHMNNEKVRIRATEKFQQLQNAWSELEVYYKNLRLSESVNTEKHQRDNQQNDKSKSERTTEANGREGAERKAEAKNREEAKRTASAERWLSREGLKYTQYKCPRCGEFNSIPRGKSPETSKCSECDEYFVKSTEMQLKRKTKFKFFRALAFYALFYAGILKLLGGLAILFMIITVPCLILFTILWHVGPDGWRTS